MYKTILSSPSNEKNDGGCSDSTGPSSEDAGGSPTDPRGGRSPASGAGCSTSPAGRPAGRQSTSQGAGPSTSHRAGASPKAGRPTASPKAGRLPPSIDSRGLSGPSIRPCSDLPPSSSKSLYDSDSETHSIDSQPFVPNLPKRHIGSFKSPGQNLEIGRDPAGEVVPLDIPKSYSLYNSPLKLEKCLGKYDRVDDYVYRAPGPKEKLPGSDPREIAMYKDVMDGGFRFPIHPFFVSIFNEFHLTPSQINPNAWRKALYFLYVCLKKGISPSMDLFRCIFEMHELVQCNAFVYFTTRVPMQFPKFRNSNSGWKSRFFFVRPSKGQFSFNTNWRHSQIRLFNSQVEATPFLEAQIQDLVDVPPLAPDLGSVLTMKNMLKVGMSRPIGMDFDLDEVLRTLPRGDEGLTLVDGAELDLEGVMDSMPDQGQEGEVDPLPIPSKRRRGADLGRKSQTINETSQPLDEPRDVVPAPRPGAPNRA
ncbi:uncharacterized protein LOC111374549 [Olea europaea var. sylvestris]|uniref:uncharacterized protein LOC111374549 n=1 Tax=Olea europaea var. sylvestris TaxID=158386 RepID=UPI000C1D7A1B|nr:uncharacterized protein LOC111374549 [Olea europaea var. sylvestris]